LSLNITVSTTGKIPFKEWLQELRDVSARAKIRVRLDRVRLGNLGDIRTVGEGVRELKVDYGPGYRIYFAQEGARIILLLLGGEKSSQNRDIKAVKEYLYDHKRRQRHD
jgi:putative addiction module killer protein